MERRVLLAIFLAFAVLYVWQAVFVKPQPKRRRCSNMRFGQQKAGFAGVLDSDNRKSDTSVYNVENHRSCFKIRDGGVFDVSIKR